MPIDTSIYSNALRPPPTVQDYDAQNQQYQINALNLQQQRQGIADSNALRQATSQFGNDSQANLQGLQKAGLYKPAQDYQASIDKSRLTGSEIGKNVANAGEQGSLASLHGLETQIKGHDFAVQKLAGLDANDPQQVASWLADNNHAGVSGFDDVNKLKGGFDQYMAAVQQGPQAVAAWKAQALQGGQSATDTLKQQQAKLIADQSNATSIANNAATNQTHLTTAGMTQAGENSRAALSRQAQFKVAGLDQNGNFAGGESSLGGLVDAIGQGKVPEGTALARTPPAMKAQIMSAVAAKYPDYDPTSIAVRQAAAKAFGPGGKEGASLRSIGTAVKHLDMMDGLVTALDNGNIQVFNKLGNAYADQTGGTAPSNFNAAKEIVGQEVVKAIVANGGGVNERKEAAEALSNAKSPQALRGVIKTYKSIMGAQHESLLQQRDAAGLPRSTLPDYTEGKGGASAPAAVSIPADIAAILQKHGAP